MTSPYRAPGDGGGSPPNTTPCPYCGHAVAVDARVCPSCNVDLDRVRCSRCFVVQRIGARACEACGAELPVNPCFDADGSPCPRCKRPLALVGHAAASGTDLYECVACGGVFVGHDALEALIAARARDERLAHLPTGGVVDPAGAALYVRCPRCDAVMNRSRFAEALPVVVDACKMHGIWFDAGEISRALAFVARGGRYEAYRHRGRRPNDPKPVEPRSSSRARPPSTFGPSGALDEGADAGELLGAAAKTIIRLLFGV